jgi:hypothetical protein
MHGLIGPSETSISYLSFSTQEANLWIIPFQWQDAMELVCLQCAEEAAVGTR